MVPPTTKPPFVPPTGFPVKLRPDVINMSTGFSPAIQVWMGAHDQIEGRSSMAGPEGERAAYYDIINQLVNLAYFHYNNYLDEVEYKKDEVKGTSFDDSAE